MKTLYIDIYFLINFTVDVLALYFAALFSRVPTSTRRICIAALIGAGGASALVFLPDVPFFKLFLSLFGYIVISALAVKPVSIKRRLKFAFAFVMFSALVGGGAYFLFDVFDKLLYDSLTDVGVDTVNRKLLIFSVLVLLSIGVFKMFISAFSSNQTEQYVKTRIVFLGKSLTLDAFVDSGNLAVDPMDMRPVLIIKEKYAKVLSF